MSSALFIKIAIMTNFDICDNHIIMIEYIYIELVFRYNIFLNIYKIFNILKYFSI